MLPKKSLLWSLSASSFFWRSTSSASCYGTSKFSETDWPVCNTVSEDKIVYSKIEGDNVLLGFHASAHTDGWSALAFGGNGGMKGAHEIVVRMDGTTWVAEDRYSNDYVTPSLDEQQNVKLLWADQSTTSGTSWAVVLPKESCDLNDYSVEDRSSYLLWALGRTHSFSYHASRGQFHANLYRNPVTPPALTGASAFDVVMPNVDVVLGDGGNDPTNPYICGIFDLRQLSPDRDYTNGKVHIGKMSAVIHGPSEEFVHHIILYSCNEDETASFTHNSLITECESMPRGCSEMVWPWAKGALDIDLPETVGLPLGQGNHWLAMQMHYYNPELKTGIKDSSGVKLFTLQVPRENDAGYLQINGGTGPSMRDPIPPGLSEFTVPSFVVPKDCTQQWNTALNVLGTIHHMHLLGTKMTLDVARNDQYLGRLRTEHHFDFNHQSLEESKLTSLLPGDEILMKCTYDTSKAAGPTEFGDFTQTEMCYALLLYYPKQTADNFIHLKPEPLDPTVADSCVQPGTEHTDISSCAQYYVQYPVNFFEYEQTPVPYSAVDMCNVGFPSATNPTVIETTPEMIMGFNPGACPACYQTKSCTLTEIKSHGQALCQDFCGNYGLTTYPDTSSTTPVTLTHKTYCGAVGTVNFNPDESIFQAPACQPVGDLDSLPPSPGSIGTEIESGVRGRSEVGLASLAFAAALFV